MADDLRGVLEALDRWSAEREALPVDTGLPRRAEWPGLPALQEFHGLWAHLRNREQVRRALAPAPVDAGPLNSRALVQRMMALMQAQSPGYLRHFTAYVDMLASLQALQAQAAPTTNDAAPARRKRARKSRGAVRSPADAE
jgi:hypothetical protein